jgi:hypothetical protein
MRTIARVLIALSATLPLATNAALKCENINGKITCREEAGSGGCGTNSDCGGNSQTTEAIRNELDKNNLDQRNSGDFQQQRDKQWQIQQETRQQKLNQ